MSRILLGILFGAAFAVGLIVVASASPWARCPRLADRIAPYVRQRPRTSRLLETPAGPSEPFAVVVSILSPFLTRSAAAIERTLGGSRSVERRLVAAGSNASVEDIRVEQAMWGVIGAFGGVVVAMACAMVSSSFSIVTALLLVATGVVTGVLSRDWWLTVVVRRREQAILAEFPVIAEFLALAVTAGEAPDSALERVCRLCSGELSRELQVALAEMRVGTTLAAALEALAKRTALDALARFVDGVVIALERGTPLADVLRAQAADVREAGKRALLAAGGRREIAMMVPVVFLILPVTVLFALYPGLVNITLLTR